MHSLKPFSPILAAIATGAVIAACGSTSPTSASSSSAVHGQSGAPYAFARCMREHGVTGFPDPIVKTTGDGTSVSQMVPGGEANTPAFKRANQACAHLEPGPQGGQGSGPASGGPSETVLLAFAKCLRAHGITNFPDPTSQGQISPATLSAAGIDVHTQRFFQAGRSCVGVTHGEITVAQVAALVNHH